MDFCCPCKRSRPVKKPTRDKPLKQLQPDHVHKKDFSVTCGTDDCPRVFSRVKSLRNHIRLVQKSHTTGSEENSGVLVCQFTETRTETYVPLTPVEETHPTGPEFMKANSLLFSLHTMLNIQDAYEKPYRFWRPLSLKVVDLSLSLSKGFHLSLVA